MYMNVQCLYMYIQCLDLLHMFKCLNVVVNYISKFLCCNVCICERERGGEGRRERLCVCMCVCVSGTYIC